MIYYKINSRQKNSGEFLEVWYEDPSGMQTTFVYVNNPKSDITKQFDKYSSRDYHICIDRKYYKVKDWNNPTTRLSSPVGLYSVKNLRITSDFGWRCLNGKNNYHTGIDIADSDIDGRKIIAAAAGYVIKSVGNQGSSKRGYGNYIIIDHGNNKSTLYGHLSKTKVQSGQWVNCYETIGYGGNTGHSYGAHLHFEFRYSGKYIPSAFKKYRKTGKYIDPYQILLSPKIKIGSSQTSRCTRK